MPHFTVMRPVLSLLTCFFFLSVLPAQYSGGGEAHPDLLTHQESLQHFKDMRFGMFIHWGAYAIPGGQRGDTICGGGAEWIMDKLDYTIEDYENEKCQFYLCIDMTKNENAQNILKNMDRETRFLSSYASLVKMIFQHYFSKFD